MPHIVVEYSKNLADKLHESQLLQQLHRVTVESELFSPEAVKSRGIAFSDYVLPHGHDRFVHVTVSILEGRTVEQRAGLSDALFTLARGLLPVEVMLSVNIHEMDAETYRK